MTQKGWGYRRIGERWLSLGMPYRNSAPVRVYGTVVINILLLPFTFILEKSDPADTTDGETAVWRGVATCPGFTASYLLVQGYDQTRGEDPINKVFFKLQIGIGLSCLVYLKAENNRGGWEQSAGYDFETMEVIANSIPASTMQFPEILGLPYGAEP
jgi:hypothetical protein